MQAGESLKEVMFHTGVADVPAHIARLAVKVKRQWADHGGSCADLKSSTQLMRLYGRSRGPVFLPHSRADAPPSVLAR